MFDYDPKAPLDVTEVAREQSDGYTVRDLTYASPCGGRVPAYLVTPAGVRAGPGPFAGLLYMHHGYGSRRTFLDEAKTLAPAGVVSLMIDSPHLRPDFPRAGQSAPAPVEEVAAAEVRLYRQLVIDLRRGLDLLVARPDVDPSRLGYVGHSLGATWGAPLAAVERRVRAYVLMAGLVSPTDNWRLTTHPALVEMRSKLPPERFELYLSILAPLDGVNFIGRAGPAAFLFQFARDDEFVSVGEAERYFALAPEPKRMMWYDSDHFFAGAPEARADRLHWLGEQLSFTPPAQARSALNGRGSRTRPGGDKPGPAGGGRSRKGQRA